MIPVTITEVLLNVCNLNRKSMTVELRYLENKLQESCLQTWITVAMRNTIKGKSVFRKYTSNDIIRKQGNETVNINCTNPKPEQTIQILNHQMSITIQNSHSKLRCMSKRLRNYSNLQKAIIQNENENKARFKTRPGRNLRQNNCEQSNEWFPSELRDCKT